jgi:hypothetical protein
MLIHLAQVQTYWRSKRCRQSMSIVSSNLLEIEEIKQHDTQGAWFRPWIQAATWHSVDKGSSSALNSNRWRARGEQQADERASAVDGCNMFYLLETIIHFIHVSFFYFDQELLQYCLQYESYFYNIWNYYFIILYNYILLFFYYVFYTCLLAVRRVSARQAALSYLVWRYSSRCIRRCNKHSCRCLVARQPCSGHNAHDRRASISQIEAIYWQNLKHTISNTCHAHSFNIMNCISNHRVNMVAAYENRNKLSLKTVAQQQRLLTWMEQ